MATAPQTTPDHRNRISEGRMLFLVPSRLADEASFGLDQRVRHQRHQRKQSEQDRRGASYRQIIPLPLRINLQMRARFFKGHFLSPPPDEPCQNLQRRARQITSARLAARIPHAGHGSKPIESRPAVCLDDTRRPSGCEFRPRVSPRRTSPRPLVSSISSSDLPGLVPRSDAVCP